MTEPDWDEIKDRMMALTLRQLRPVIWWFSGCLGGCMTKADKCSAMASQMRHWWHMPDGYGRQRVRNVLKDLEEVESGVSTESH